jgi:hypothetical protein
VRSHRRLSWIPLLALLATLIGGCGRAPNAPVVTELAPASAAVKPAASETGLLGDLVGGVLRLVVKVLNLVGSIGGSLTNGRWRVDIPAGAVAGNGRVTLAVTSSTSPDCTIEISPITLNDFEKPVSLTVNCPGVSSRELANYAIFWWDPSARRWVQQESQVDLAAKTVSAKLRHFSTYKVGSKASW